MSSGSNSDRIAARGIWVGPTNTVNTKLQANATVEAAVGFLQCEVAKHVNSMYGLSPPLKPSTMQAQYFPSGRRPAYVLFVVEPNSNVSHKGADLADQMNVCRNTGLTALFSPSFQDSRRIGNLLVQKNQEHTRLIESHKALAEVAINDLSKSEGSAGNGMHQHYSNNLGIHRLYLSSET